MGETGPTVSSSDSQTPFRLTLCPTDNASMEADSGCDDYKHVGRCDSCGRPLDILLKARTTPFYRSVLSSCGMLCENGLLFLCVESCDAVSAKEANTAPRHQSEQNFFSKKKMPSCVSKQLDIQLLPKQFTPAQKKRRHRQNEEESQFSTPPPHQVKRILSRFGSTGKAHTRSTIIVASARKKVCILDTANGMTCRMIDDGIFRRSSAPAQLVVVNDDAEECEGLVALTPRVVVSLALCPDSLPPLSPPLSLSLPSLPLPSLTPTVCLSCAQGNTDYKVVHSDFAEYMKSHHSRLEPDRLGVGDMKRCLDKAAATPRHYVERSDLEEAFTAVFTPSDDALFDVIWYDACASYGDAIQTQLLEARRLLRKGGILAITVSQRGQYRDSVDRMCCAHLEQVMGVYTYSGGENDMGAPMAFCYGIAKPPR